MQTYNVIAQYINVADLTRLILSFAFGDEKTRVANAFYTGYVEICIILIKRVNILFISDKSKQILLHSLLVQSCEEGHTLLIDLCLFTMRQINGTINKTIKWGKLLQSACKSDNLRVVKCIGDIIDYVYTDYNGWGRSLSVAYRYGSNTLISYLEKKSKYHWFSWNFHYGSPPFERYEIVLAEKYLFDAYYSENITTIALAKSKYKGNIDINSRYLTYMLRKACDENNIIKVKKKVEQMNNLSLKCFYPFYMFYRDDKTNKDTEEIFKLIANKLILDGTILPIWFLLSYALRNNQIITIESCLKKISPNDEYKIIHGLSECNLKNTKYVLEKLGSSFLSNNIFNLISLSCKTGNIELVEFLTKLPIYIISSIKDG